MKKIVLSSVLVFSMISPAIAADYEIDVKGAHASINWKIQHLGYSWLTGRFNEFSGNFKYDAENIEATEINVIVNTLSLDSNHAERDKHLRSPDFLDTEKYGQASFKSTSVKDLGNEKLSVDGVLNFHGVSKPITINATKIGEGKDPWGGYRVGFSGTFKLKLADFGVPVISNESSYVLMDLHIEGKVRENKISLIRKPILF